jgi:ABC-type transport system substrate-binding protein
MKRAAILILAIATLVLLGSPSTPLLAGSSPTKSTTGPSVVAPTSGSIDTGAPASGGGGGGTDQGDADGLSGMKIKPGTQVAIGGMTPGRLAITATVWWRFMLFIR